jgi:hypothetical protein
MSAAGQPAKPRQKLFDGRTGRRVYVSVPVYLTHVEQPQSRELTTIENVSSHGACAISRRLWQSGEEALVTLLRDEFPLVGTVVYCHARTSGGFCLGLEFPDTSGKWANYYRNISRL